MQADRILTNGRIYTVDSNHLWVEAVAMRAGKILAVGTNDEMLALAGPETDVMDVGGAAGATRVYRCTYSLFAGGCAATAGEFVWFA